MATSTSQKILCATCGKTIGMFTCRGCEKEFCTRHVVEHRQELGKQMDELTLDHDRFRQALIEQTKQPRHHPLMKQIDEWEEQSIDKIRRSANDARQQLQNTISEQTTKLTAALTKIADELRIARENDDFFETDLNQWMIKLGQLKNDLAHPPNVTIRREENNTILSVLNIVRTILIRETFARSTGDIQIEDNGQVIVKDSNGHEGARGSGEYSSGQHRFRFRVEEHHTHQWILIGIVSKSAVWEASSYHTPSSYGWAGGSQVFLNGVQHDESNGYKSDIEKNDVVELFVDCDKRTLRLTNERARSVYELQIGTSKCSFPWQLNFNLYWANNRLRILGT